MSFKKKKSLIITLCLTFLIVFITASPWSAEGGREAEHRVNLGKEVWKWVNFIILISVIYKFLSKPLKEFLSARIESIKRMLAESRDALTTAEKKLKEAEKVLEGLGSDIEGIRKNSKEIMELEKKRVADETDEIRRKISNQTENEIEQLKKKAKIKISNELVNKAAGIAEESLKKKITKDYQKILVEKYISSLERLN